MYCVFCRSEQAVHLEKGFELCQACIDVRDFMQEYNAEKRPGQGPIEWARDYLQFAQTDGATA